MANKDNYSIRDLAENSRNTESFYNSKKEKYDLSINELKQIKEMKKGYNTNFQTIFEFIDKGYKLNEIDLFYSARELSKDSPVQPYKPKLKFGEKFPSLKSFSKIYSLFGSSGMGSEDLACMAEEIHNEMGYNNYNKSIEKIIDYSRNFDFKDYKSIFNKIEEDREKKFFSRKKSLDDFF
ncbi:MAG: hypothetical protein ACOCRX_03705 [Candidatus Woesearchaeota archaeon]